MPFEVVEDMLVGEAFVLPEVDDCVVGIVGQDNRLKVRLHGHFR